MNRNFIFVFILFATFSIISAVPHQLRKRETTFDSCQVEGIDPLTVTISPDPPVSGQPETYTVSGKLSKDITADKTILGIAYADQSQSPLGDPYTQTFTESYKAGDQFSITADKVPTPQLPNSYLIGVIVEDPTDDPNNPIDVYGCAFASVGASNEVRGYPIAERSYPITERGYPIAERSYPIAERGYPIAERSYPIAERS